MKFRSFMLAIAVGSACLWTVPRCLAGRQATRYYEDSAEAQQALVRGVTRVVQNGVLENSFHTGAPLFDQEWVFGTYMMAAMGLGQVALAHPELREEHTLVMEHCIDELLTKRVRSFDTESWGSDPLESLNTNEGHVAYLGYLGLVLGLHQRLNPYSRYSDLYDNITDALARRYDASRSKLLATYPGQYFPVDNLAAIGALALHAGGTGSKREGQVAALVNAVRTRYLDHETGLLVQRVDAAGRPVDAARGSGSALGAYFAVWASPELALDLHVAVKHQLTRAPLGFGMVREYIQGSDGPGDIDSGPLVAGMSISATGFSLASARVAGDFEHFEAVYRTAHLFGAPTTTGAGVEFVSGGPLGNALMLALMTAPKPKVLL